MRTEGEGDAAPGPGAEVPLHGREDQAGAGSHIRVVLVLSEVGLILFPVAVMGLCFRFVLKSGLIIEMFLMWEVGRKHSQDR